MKIKEKTGDVGVIVARFQIFQLHDGHKKLIDHVRSNHARTIIILGLSPLKTTVLNPLDFQARKQMIQEDYPDIDVLYIKNIPSDEEWSKKLDLMISDLIGPNQIPILYGSRDSFIKCYSGRNVTIELESDVYYSATEERELIAKTCKPNKDFRAGIIWATQNTYPMCLATVDIAILNEDETEILLGKKPNEQRYRFIGGFSTPDCESYEIDAQREAQEETGLEIGNIEYIGSLLIDDWRFRKEKNKIKTLFFKAKKIFGRVEPGDDIAELKWWDLKSLKESDMVEEHIPLLRKLLK